MLNISDFLKDASGQFSAMRAVCVLGIATIIGVWATMCLRAGAVLNIPEGVVYALSIFVVGKMGQKYIENKNGQAPVEVATQIKQTLDESENTENN